MSVECVVYIAVSVDGFIARSDDDVSWLDHPDYAMPGDEDFGYRDLMRTIDALVMGRRSFEKVLSFGTWPYQETPVIILSGSQLDIPGNMSAKVRTADATPDQLVRQWEADGLKRLYIDGGETIRRFLRAGLIDEITLTQIPILLGEGISLFAGLGMEVELKRQQTRSYDNGFVQTTYQVVR